MHFIEHIIVALHQLPNWAEVLVECALILLLTVFLSFIENLIYRHFYPRLRKNDNTHLDVFFYAFHRPLQLLIWSFGATYVVSLFVEVVSPDSSTDIVSAMGTTRHIFIVIAVAWIINRFIQLVEEQWIRNSKHRLRKVDKATAFAISRILKILVIAAAGLILLQVNDIPVSSLIAIGGAGTLVVGLAARDTLANFFGSLMIYTDRPFSVGDWIRSPDRNVEGTVEEIGWRLTRIRTFDKRPLYVPNSIFSTIALENPSRMHNRRIDPVIGIRYEDARVVKVIRDDIEAMLKNHPDIDTLQTLFVRVIDFSASAINIQVYTFTKTTDWVLFQKILEDVLLQILDIIHQHGADLAYPTQTLFLNHENPPPLEAQHGRLERHS